MFEHLTFDVLLERMLDRVPDDIDKREGSVIYDALAPTAMEHAELYAAMDLLLQRTFADSADGDDLTRRVAEHGVFRRLATAALREGTFTAKDEPFSVPVGSRYSLSGIIYTVVERLSPPGHYSLRADVTGEAGNQDYGELVPVDQVDGLGGATLGRVLIPGQNEESDESLYARYEEHLREKAFGGNRADYKHRILEQPGVGGVRLYRAPAGGGTVGATIISSEYKEPTAELVEAVQTAIDPTPYTGDGYGTAPIGHEVLITGVIGEPVNFSATLQLSGSTLGQVEPLVKETIESYLAELRKEWARKDDPLIVRLIQIEARLLQIDGIQDILQSSLNGLPQNVVLEDNIPVLGEVVLNE
ncbi:baseplate J/gp47 family protein [Sporosarcina trichiuri]|uniref:baseplate J/gp47 family protein n=1 Tax=Sporosarcina trichiuri TaxID=3056445 RepID=UPI0025B34517|nr:baseplate J/gp47 family protein [Sporosarcina sp. 0.2-SM1T-5]WJY27485.1 baseplate J/gp47 family protein [Sporosarcina sp. 0.2-SM1T-5]